MSDELLEQTVEEIMRMYHMNNFNDYNNEELREYYRKMLKEDVVWPLPKPTNT